MNKYWKDIVVEDNLVFEPFHYSTVTDWFFIYKNTHKQIYMYVCVCACVCGVCITIYIYIYIYMYIYTHTCIPIHANMIKR